ncbi:MAG: alkaline phosphatase, partial [Pseudomonadota bacterium]
MLNQSGHARSGDWHKDPGSFENHWRGAVILSPRGRFFPVSLALYLHLQHLSVLFPEFVLAIEIYSSSRKVTAVLIAATLLSACAQQLSQSVPQALDASIAHRLGVTDNTSTARNVILFVGDGMGVATVTAARIYDGQTRGETGEENSLAFESFDHLALVKTYNTNQQVPDSAGTATAMLSGVKTRAGVIGVGPTPQRQDCVGARQHTLPTIADDVKAVGKAVGVVTTTRITHATPASLYAHSSERDYESDAYMNAERRANCVDIARQLLQFDSGRGLDVMFGGGYGEFVGKNLGGIRFDADADLVADWLSGDPARQFIQTADGLSKLNPDA